MAGAPDDEADLEHLAGLAVAAVAAAAGGEAPADPGDDPVARRVAHVVTAIATGGEAAGADEADG